LTKKDLALVGDVWYKSSTVQVKFTFHADLRLDMIPTLISQFIFPGGKPLIGYRDIMAMWQNSFHLRDKFSSSVEIRPSNVRISVRGLSAFVVCNEDMVTQKSTQRLLATNIFFKSAGKWRLVHHHADARGGTEAEHGSESWLSGGGWGGGPRVVRIEAPMGADGQVDAASLDETVVEAMRAALGDNRGKLRQGGSDLEIRDSTGDVIGSFSVGDIDDEEEDSSSDIDAEDEEGERLLDEDATDGAVEGLRQLAKDGRISREEKRRLMSSIIEHHHAGGPASEVEIAYELLVLRPATGSAEKAELLDDFAEQCRALAARMQ
jgi:hypothetical protein